MPHHLGLPSHDSFPYSLSHMFRDGRDSQLCSMPPLHELAARSGCFAHVPVMLPSALEPMMPDLLHPGIIGMACPVRCVMLHTITARLVPTRQYVVR